MSKSQLSRSMTANIVRSRSVVMGSAIAAVFGLAGFGASSASAAPTQYFDPGALLAAPGSGGTGSWDTATPDWYVSGTADSPYVAANASTFAGTAGTVTLGSAITSSGGITFTTAGYTLDLAGNTLTSSGQFNENAANTTFTSSAPGGVINEDATKLFVINAANASLTIGSQVTVNIANASTSFQNGAFRINQANTALTLNGGTLNVAGTTLLAHSINTGTLNLTSGQITPGYGFGFDTTSGSGIVNFGGATINLVRTLSDLINPTQTTQGVTPTSLKFNDVAGGGGVVINTNGFNLGFAEAIKHSDPASLGTADGGFTMHGGGTVTLSGASTYTGNTTVTNGTLVDNNAVSGVGTGNVFVAADSAAGATFQLNDAADLTPLQSLTLTDFAGSADSALANLNYTGTDTIASLVDNGVLEGAGVYGGSGSGATNQVSFLTGTGTLTIAAVPEPATIGILSMTALGLLRLRRRLA